MNRKMFKKSRPARDALNQAGGIMDSSPELMQTVQNYPVPGVQKFARGMSVFTDPTSPFFRPSTANRVSGPEDISDIRIPGRSIYAEEGPGDGTVLRQLKDTFQMRQDPNYIPLNERGISTIKHFMGERYPFAPSTNYGDPNYQPIFDPYKQQRIYAKSGMAPDIVLDDKGISTGYDTDGNLVLSQPRQAFTVDDLNPADLSKSGIATQLATDKAAIAKFQAANPNEYVPLTQAEIIEKQAANPALLNVEGTEAGVLTKMNPVEERALDLQGQYADLKPDEALRLAAAQIDKEKETDFVAAIAKDTEAEKFEKARREQPSEAQQRELEIIKAYKDDQTEAFERARRASTGDSEVVESLTTGTDIAQLKKNVTDVVQNGTPDMQRASLDALINEFKDRAPKFEGQNMSLAIAKMGFAIAAGDSPSAITNIANGLRQGAEDLIKNKAKKDEFNRQLDLSALQYGLGEQSKYRAEDRTIKRADLAFNRQIELADRKLNYFVADTAGVGENGQKFIKGDQVGITDGYIRNNGVPSGLTTEKLVNATAVRAAAAEKYLQEQKAKKIITNKDYLSLSKRVDEAELKFTKSRNLQTLVQGQIFNVTDGKVTGITAGATKLMNNAANAAGIDLGAAYETPAEYDRAMQKVANSMIQEILGEGSKNLSNVDRQLASEIVGLFAKDWKGQIFADKDVQLSRLQGVLSDMQRSEQASLKELSDITALVSGQTLPSGQQVTFGKTQSVFEAIDGGFKVKPLEGTWSFDTEDNVLRMK